MQLCRVERQSRTAAVTATQSHPPPSTEHDLRLRKPTNARYDGSQASLNLRVGGSIPRGAHIA